ncbi:PAS domain S-box protein [Thermodesulfobacteriota bacterium]
MNSEFPEKVLEELEPIEAIILRSINEGVITLECTGNVHMVNPAALGILGHEADELVGRNLHDIFEDEPENEHFREIISDVVHRDLPTVRSETVYVRKDGQTVDLSVATSFLEIPYCEPGMENIVVVFRDITAFKAIERARRRAVDHLSHELKTPLAIIEASVSSLSRKEYESPSVKKGLARIERNLHRLSGIQEIVEKIMIAPQVKPQSFTPADRVQEIIAESREQCPDRSLRIENRSDSSEVDSIDPDIFSVVMSTLLKNAVECTPDEGLIVISLESVTPDLLLTAEDYGVGIIEADKEFLFDGFHHTQLTDEYSTKRPFDFNAGGKGLELLRLKILAEEGLFHISFDSRRCHYIPTNHDHCPGRISECRHVKDPAGCKESGGTTFSVKFHGLKG